MFDFRFGGGEFANLDFRFARRDLFACSPVLSHFKSASLDFSGSAWPVYLRTLATWSRQRSNRQSSIENRQFPTFACWCRLRCMVFMAIERFKPGSIALIAERFQRSGSVPLFRKPRPHQSHALPQRPRTDAAREIHGSLSGRGPSGSVRRDEGVGPGEVTPLNLPGASPRARGRPRTRRFQVPLPGREVLHRLCLQRGLYTGDAPSLLGVLKGHT